MSKTRSLLFGAALVRNWGCSADGGNTSGAEGEGDSGSDSGSDSDSSSDSSGEETGETGPGACEDDSDFNDPPLRDCDLPGACGTCMWEKACASFLFRCSRNADCVCAAECVGQAGVNAWPGCLDQCGLTDSPPGFADWLKGASDMCYDEGCGILQDPPVDPDAPDGDPGAGTEADCAFDPEWSYHPCNEVLQLQSADGSVCARIERRNDGPGDDANTKWTLLDVRVGPLGQVCHTDVEADLCWFNSHHNYAEWLHVECGGLHYEINIGQGCGEESNPSSNFQLHVFEKGGTECSPTSDGSCEVVAPMELFPA